MHSPLPLTRDIVLIGGGHAHALLARMWGMKPLAGARLTLINPAPTAPYSGMLPGHIAGHYRRQQLEIDLVRLARFAGVRLVLDRVVGIDRAARRVQLERGPDIFYDVASINVGITTELPDIPGFSEHALGAKPLDRYVTRWAEFTGEVAQGLSRPEVVVIGGGVAGVELALAMMYRLRRLGAGQAHVTVIEAGAQPLGGLAAGTRARLLREMERAGVVLMTNTKVARIAAGAVHLEGGGRLDSGLTLGVGTARAQGWLAATGLADEAGFVPVGETLKTLADPRIYAAGDCAELSHAPRPKAGVYAVREAPVLFHNLRAEVTGGRMRPYRPQKDFLKLISTGGKAAVADKAGLRAGGPLLWRWKDRIDRKFMRKFADYPRMPAPALPREMAEGVREELGEVPLCGGCGAKVGAGGLAGVLADLPAPRRADVLSRPGDDAAVLAWGEGQGAGQQVLTTDHLRAFSDDPVLMARVAAVHALGDIWAMGARPQAALASIVLPRMRPEMQRETLREIMQAASEVFRAAGAEVVGGHTSQGAEMTLGFAVSGLADRAVRHTGARAGDGLIVTRPLGSGTILAAEMRGLADGRDVARAWAQMQRLQTRASAILAPVAHAMTDITGFGLAGHLQAMLAGSGNKAKPKADQGADLGAELWLEQVPLMAGAEALAARGVRSTIWAANRGAVTAIGQVHGPRAALMFDPQTAGGLLAAVPMARADEVLEALRAAGEGDAALIGRVRRGDGGALVFAP